jgi:hypothetical protein
MTHAHAAAARNSKNAAARRLICTNLAMHSVEKHIEERAAIFLDSYAATRSISA